MVRSEKPLCKNEDLAYRSCFSTWDESKTVLYWFEVKVEENLQIFWSISNMYSMHVIHNRSPNIEEKSLKLMDSTALNIVIVNSERREKLVKYPCKDGIDLNIQQSGRYWRYEYGILGWCTGPPVMALSSLSCLDMYQGFLGQTEWRTMRHPVTGNIFLSNCLLDSFLVTISATSFELSKLTAMTCTFAALVGVLGVHH